MVYNICNQTPAPLMDLLRTIERSWGQEAQKNFLPMQPGDVIATYADIKGLRRDVGFEPKTLQAEVIENWAARSQAFHDLQKCLGWSDRSWPIIWRPWLCALGTCWAA